MNREVWVREDRNGRPVKAALTLRGVGEPDQYGNRPARYVPADLVEADARALWAVRVLDRWRKQGIGKRRWTMTEAYDYDGIISAHCCHVAWGDGDKDYAGDSEDAARIAAAKALVAEDTSLGEGL